MNQKKKNKLKDFNHNIQKNSQKLGKKAGKGSNTAQISSVLSNKNGRKIGSTLKKFSIVQTVAQEITSLTSKTKTWLNLQTKNIENAIKSDKPQIINQISIVKRVFHETINSLKLLKCNFKYNTKSNIKLDKPKICHPNALEISSILSVSQSFSSTQLNNLPLSQSTPKIQRKNSIFPIIQPAEREKFNNSILSIIAQKNLTDIKFKNDTTKPLPKLMSLDVKPSKRLEKIFNDLLQMWFDGSHLNGKYNTNSSKYPKIITESKENVLLTKSSPLQPESTQKDDQMDQSIYSDQNSPAADDDLQNIEWNEIEDIEIRKRLDALTDAKVLEIFGQSRDTIMNSLNSIKNNHFKNIEQINKKRKNRNIDDDETMKDPSKKINQNQI
jgi:hypothetical protein